MSRSTEVEFHVEYDECGIARVIQVNVEKHRHYLCARCDVRGYGVVCWCCGHSEMLQTKVSSVLIQECGDAVLPDRS